MDMRIDMKKLLSNRMTSLSRSDLTAWGSRMLIVLAVLLMLTAAFSFVAFAATEETAFAGSVTYEGKDKGFDFAPGGDSGAEIIEGLSDIVPGDTVDDDITVKNASGQKVKIYMRAVSPDTSGKAFLSQLDLTVKEGGKTLTDGKASEQKGLSSWKSLGTFSRGSSKKLLARVSAPIEMGDEYQDKKSEIVWQFKAESSAGEEDNGGGTKTGDTANIAMWAAIGIIALALIIAAAKLKAGRR